jgi:hypothetical protein
MQDLVVIKNIYFLNDENYVITNNMDENQIRLIVHWKRYKTHKTLDFACIKLQ